MKRRAKTGAPDLFQWRDINDDLTFLEARRAEIAAQIQRAKPKSHRRVALEERLKQFTNAILKEVSR